MAGTSDESPTADVLLDMREEDQQQLMAFLRCNKCKNLADDAVETLCCHTLLCSACLIKLDRVCPTCQQGCSDCPSHLARRLIGCQPWSCRFCGQSSTRSEAADHNRLCPRQQRACPAKGCGFRGLPDAFVVHLTTAHKSQLLGKVTRLFGCAGRAQAATAAALGVDAASGRLSASVLRFYNAGFARDPSRTHAAVTGKNYCHGRLNGPACECCDGTCGPSNGCNCVVCMRSDLVTFGVGSSQQRCLVNREGVISKLSPETNKFYCGRANMGHDPMTDGFCGPNNGNNCHACRQLDIQVRDRYASIAAEWA